MMIGNNNDHRRNSYGYSDPTAYSLINKENQEEYERMRNLLHALRAVCAVAGFEFGDRVVLVDKRTGREWR